ncbi:hypothetical protein SAMN02745146_0832 [Hymenobacter daecheongensis DSM 21074]|uniref:Uncharacterized protein n=1 Tax=Hymenobacter daecheongensis DSM 21074 TaxID=1121955 RepID=A0A1M6B0Z6_9BACT|nr:hypothetical protein [Hymenobacter daecheongensis]SHI42248.1 hypothetical protein SAMN02745146_0832 [Hymenobacter daecheongensis DSM 21074]
MAIDPNNRPVRVINDDTTDQEFTEGHIIPGANPPKNEAARGGFGNRDGKEGFGTDSGSGSTAVSVNEDSDRAERPADNIRTADEGADQRPNQDMPADDELSQRRVTGPVDELDADDRNASRDEMRNPNSRVGMGQMEQVQPDSAKTGATTQTNAELTDPNASDTAIDQ